MTKNHTANEMALFTAVKQNKVIEQITDLLDEEYWSSIKVTERKHKYVLQITALKYLFKIASHHAHLKIDVCPTELQKYFFQYFSKLYTDLPGWTDGKESNLHKYTGNRTKHKLDLLTLFQIKISRQGCRFKSLKDEGGIPEESLIEHQEIERWLCSHFAYYGGGFSDDLHRQFIELYIIHHEGRSIPDEIENKDSSFYSYLSTLATLPLYPATSKFKYTEFLAPNFPWNVL